MTVTAFAALLVIAVVVVIFWIFFSNKLYAISLNPSLAKSKGVNTKIVENLFVIIVATIVMISIRWVGILIINSMLILPAAASRNIARNLREYHVLSVIFALLSGMLGLVISYYIGVATGPTIVMIASLMFFVTYFIRSKIGD